MTRRRSLSSNVGVINYILQLCKNKKPVKLQLEQFLKCFNAQLKSKMQLCLLLSITFFKICQGCQPTTEGPQVKYHTLVRGNDFPISSSNGRWHITRDSICKAKLTCNNFYISPSEDCLISSLEIIDGNLIKLRFCGYSSNLGETNHFSKSS